MISRVYDLSKENQSQYKVIGDKFFALSIIPGSFNVSHFFHFWQTLINIEAAAVWKVEIDGQFVGAISGIESICQFTGDRVVTEGFWFMDEAFRNTRWALILFKTLNDWAVERKAARIMMAHLSTSMPEALANFYARQGYIKLETHHVRIL